MKELFKVISKKLLIYSTIISIIYSIAYYGQSFALSYFGTNPLTIDKVLKLTIAIIILDIVSLITVKLGSYIDNINEIKILTKIKEYYFI